MKYTIPTKTFLLGEYAALSGQRAVLVTTTPCFVLETISEAQLLGIHPESPAGKLWAARSHGAFGLKFYDPFQGLGGLGASSAQFIGAWLACYPGIDVSVADLLQSYWAHAWDGTGLRPSGYDIQAQMLNKIVSIQQSTSSVQSMDWDFADIDFLLIHSGQKLATHLHLQSARDASQYTDLHRLAEQGIEAIETKNSTQLISVINAARLALQQRGLQSAHTLTLIEQMLMIPGVYAAKGCGAMGADIIVVLLQKNKVPEIRVKIQEMGLKILASNQEVYREPPIFTEKSQKKLEILAQ